MIENDLTTVQRKRMEEVIMKRIHERIVAIMLVILQIMTLVPTGAFALPEDSIPGYSVIVNYQPDTDHPLQDYYVVVYKEHSNYFTSKSIDDIKNAGGWTVREIKDYYTPNNPAITISKESDCQGIKSVVLPTKLKHSTADPHWCNI